MSNIPARKTGVVLNLARIFQINIDTVIQKPMEGKYKNLSASNACNGIILDTGINAIKNQSIPKDIVLEFLYNLTVRKKKRIIMAIEIRTEGSKMDNETGIL